MMLGRRTRRLHRKVVVLIPGQFLGAHFVQYTAIVVLRGLVLNTLPVYQVGLVMIY